MATLGSSMGRGFMQVAQTIVMVAQAYAAVGAAIAAVFLLFGIDRIDPAARGTFSFRPLLVPGLLLLWPFVIVRWIALERAAPESDH
jgi:hypothetical protein